MECHLFKDEHKALKELQSDTSIVILLPDKDRSTVILNREDYLGKCMDHINDGPYQLLKKSQLLKPFYILRYCVSYWFFIYQGIIRHLSDSLIFHYPKFCVKSFNHSASFRFSLCYLLILQNYSFIIKRKAS